MGPVEYGRACDDCLLAVTACLVAVAAAVSVAECVFSLLLLFLLVPLSVV